MAKTHLNAQSRRDLLNYAAENIKSPVEREALDKAYDKAADLVKRDFEKAFPVADMEVLAKYGSAELDRCVRGTHTPRGSDEGAQVMGFSFRSGPVFNRLFDHGAVTDLRLSRDGGHPL